MNRCTFGFHDWAYSTRSFTYAKNGHIVDEKEEVYKRTCQGCKRTERNVGPYNRWVRVVEDTPNKEIK